MHLTNGNGFNVNSKRTANDKFNSNHPPIVEDSSTKTTNCKIKIIIILNLESLIK